MRFFLSNLALLSFLFVSIEGAADVVVDGIPHGDPISHEQEYGHALDAHGGEISDSELDGDHCDHCCHGHSSGIAHSNFVSALGGSGQRVLVLHNEPLPDFLLTPPTPPPDPHNLS